ncbi:MAG: MBOAT family protein [Bacteroidales bacterium]|nr:MBOAT family protein [Bacteroidales bacterium]
MNFFSPEFFGYFLIVITLYYTLDNKYQKFLILLASSVFIGSLSISILAYTYLFILLNYLFAHLLTKFKERPSVKKIIFNISMFIVIGALVFFKYINFILSSVIQFLHIFHLNIQDSSLKLILPIGISFYTFQSIGYLLQIYRGNEDMEKNIIIFFNYFLFFPKFLSGPIEQSKHFFPQLKNTFHFSYSNFVTGMRFILWGAFKKLVIADRLALIIDGLYPNLHQFSGNLLIITFLLQPLHVYCDFSGYTDIAIGMGKIFGLKLTENFRQPFFSTGVSDFWRRWHMSLTNWCNEYIFKRIMFKKRKWGIWASVYALFVTFLVIGIWHGPHWNFIILGILQGIAINYEFFTKRFRLRIAGKLPKKPVLYMSYLITYLFVCFSLVFFYAPSTSDATYFLSHIFTNIDFSKINLLFLDRMDKIIVLFSLLFVLIMDFRQENGKGIMTTIGAWPGWVRKAYYYVILILLIYFGSPVKEFVYMQF